MEHTGYMNLLDTYGQKFDGSLYAESVSEVKIELNEYAADDRLIQERIEDSRKKRKEQQKERQRQTQKIRTQKKRRDSQER